MAPAVALGRVIPKPNMKTAIGATMVTALTQPQMTKPTMVRPPANINAPPNRTK